MSQSISSISASSPRPKIFFTSNSHICYKQGSMPQELSPRFNLAEIQSLNKLRCFTEARTVGLPPSGPKNQDKPHTHILNWNKKSKDEKERQRRMRNELMMKKLNEISFRKRQPEYYDIDQKAYYTSQVKNRQVCRQIILQNLNRQHQIHMSKVKSQSSKESQYHYCNSQNKKKIATQQTSYKSRIGSRNRGVKNSQNGRFLMAAVSDGLQKLDNLQLSKRYEQKDDYKFTNSTTLATVKPHLELPPVNL